MDDPSASNANAHSTEEAPFKKGLGSRLAWVGAASSAVAVLDLLAIVLILKFWVTPATYGIATIVVTLFWALQLAAELGLSAAVIQRDGHSQEQLSTLFWMNVMFGVIFYAVIWVGSPYFALLHDEPVIESLCKVFGINLLVRSGYAMHHAQLRKQLRFRELSIVRIIGNLLEFSFKVGTAAAGFGVWCFVAGSMARSLTLFVGLPLINKWRPSFVFQPKKCLGDIVFGARSAGGEILFQVYSNLDYQVISIFFGKEVLGIYRAAYELVLEPVRFISGVVVSVAFPAFSKVKNNLKEVAKLYAQFTTQNLVVVLSLLVLILISAEDLLTIIFKEEYAVAATAARILAIVGVFRALSHIAPPLLEGLGRPDLTLRYQITAAILVSGLFFGFAYYLGDQFGYVVVAAAWAVGYPIAFTMLSIMVFRLSKMSVYDWLKAIAMVPFSIALGGLLGLGAHLAARELSPLPRLVIVITVLAISIGFFLAKFAKISPRSVLRAVKDEPVSN